MRGGDHVWVLGCCFIAAGFRGGEQEFDATIASTMSSLMAVSSASLVVPAILWAALSTSDPDVKEDDSRIMFVSRGTSIVLLLLYISYLFLQLKTHHYLFDAERKQSDNGEQEHVLPTRAAVVVLAIVTIMVAVYAQYLVDSIDNIVETTHTSKTLISLILTPTVGNAAEHITACIVAYKGKMDLAIGVAIGRSLQIASFVTPALVLSGWVMDAPMNLHF